ncbi:MAG: hypothetical protein HQK54_08515 [Oligoflexales bacterium]|nr:hypothetical protein [Oligoflexales bacterium]
MKKTFKAANARQRLRENNECSDKDIFQIFKKEKRFSVQCLDYDAPKSVSFFAVSAKKLDPKRNKGFLDIVEADQRQIDSARNDNSWH